MPLIPDEFVVGRVFAGLRISVCIAGFSRHVTLFALLKQFFAFCGSKSEQHRHGSHPELGTSSPRSRRSPSL